jgi:hypothetical protein
MRSGPSSRSWPRRKVGLVPGTSARPGASTLGTAARAPRGPRAPGAEVPEVTGRAWQLLRLTRRLRTHERRELTDFLHDGPIQELTALALDLQLMSRSGGVPGGGVPGGTLDAMLQRLDAATGALRWLIEESWSLLTPETQLAAAIKERTSWLLSEPVIVDAGRKTAAVDPADVPVIVDVVELLLLGVIPPGQLARAEVAVRTPRRLIQIEVTLTAAVDGDLAGDRSAALASLDELACALGASAQATLGSGRWRASLALPNRPGAVVT